MASKNKPFKIFALGQCGTRLAQNFANFDLDICYINSDSGDMKGISSKNVLQLDTSGTGGSPIKGREMVNKNIKSFNAFIKANSSDKCINLVLAGAGGGTGGGIVAPTLEALKSLGVKTGCVLTLPPKSLGMLAADNSMRTLKEVRQVELNYFVLVDNDHLIDKCNISSAWWGAINKYIVNTIMLPFTIVNDAKTSKDGFGSIDKGEVNRILQYGSGLIDIRHVSFTKKEILSMDEKEIKAKLFNPSLVSGYDYKNSLAYMVSIDMPEKANYNAFANTVLEISQKAAGSAISRVGTFTSPHLKEEVDVIMINAGLKLPKVLNNRMNNLKRDNQRFAEKKSKTDSIDLSIDDSMISNDFDLD
jgi:cell division GTPase FtsZ